MTRIRQLMLVWNRRRKKRAKEGEAYRHQGKRTKKQNLQHILRIFSPREAFLKDEEPFLYSSLRTSFKNPMLMGLPELPLHDSQGGSKMCLDSSLKTPGEVHHGEV